MPETELTRQSIRLTAAQEEQLLEFWNSRPSDPPSLKEMIQKVFGEGFDGRSMEGKAVRDSLVKMSIRPVSATDIAAAKREKAIPVELTEEQKTYIQNNRKGMKSLEMAKILFNDQTLTNLHAQVRAVYNYVRALDTRDIYKPQQDDAAIPEGGYEPPDSFEKTLRLINKYTRLNLDKDEMTVRQRKNVNILNDYLHIRRFGKQMNTYENISDRELCEDAFIRSTYDKPDLAQEEVDQYIEYSNQVVQGFKVLRRKELMDKNYEAITTSNLENPEMQQKARMDLVEAIGKAGVEYQQILGRQQKLLDDLKEKRSVRLSKEIAESASMLSFVQLWKFEEEREALIKLAEHEQQNIGNEVERLTTVSELKARILGADKDAILNG